MIRFSCEPDNFNVAVIKPLVKDPRLAIDTTDNLRPVAISEALANLFEKILLFEINKTH